MGTSIFIQHEVMSKKMVPAFHLPQDKILNTSHLKSKCKPLGECLKGGSSKPYERKDLDPKWDSVF